VIEQYPIATTPKYNFPQPSMDTVLPQQFMELSVRSLKPVQTQRFQLNQQYFHQISGLEEPTETFRLSIKPIPLKPDHQRSIVAAVDTSIIKIGETSQGMVIAVRGADVWKQNKVYRYVRLGPFVFHITDENKREVYDALERSYFSCSSERSHQCVPNFLQMPSRIASLLERWIQAMLSKTIDDGLVLFDGSLTSGTSDTPVQRMKDILNNARSKGNVVLAFSKMTNLRVNGHVITDSLPMTAPPYLLETEGLRLRPPMTLLGDVYVARLTTGNCAFRLDIDKEVPAENKIKAVEKLLGNDLLTQSYPETLRLAHILCTFTANEVLAMQHFVTRKYGLQIVNRPDMHRLLFGPFGKGENYS
jgi:hypothetical protein